jgi:hypothetical protein
VAHPTENRPDNDRDAAEGSASDEADEADLAQPTTDWP